MTRPVVLAVETSDTELKDPFGNLKRAATVTARINRKEFGPGWGPGVRGGPRVWRNARS